MPLRASNGAGVTRQRNKSRFKVIVSVVCFRPRETKASRSVLITKRAHAKCKSGVIVRAERGALALRCSSRIRAPLLNARPERPTVLAPLLFTANRCNRSRRRSPSRTKRALCARGNSSRVVIKRESSRFAGLLIHRPADVVLCYVRHELATY